MKFLNDIDESISELMNVREFIMSQRKINPKQTDLINKINDILSIMKIIRREYQIEEIEKLEI
jgi:hypothetical protein